MAAETFTPEAVSIRAANAADRAWIAEAHARLYTQDDGFDDSFGQLVDRLLQTFFASADPSREAGLIAQAGAERLGCIFCTRQSEDTARLRMFLLLPEARGLGLGQKLHDAALSFARRAGYRRIVLSTHESHAAACRLYARNGWQILSRQPVFSFGQALTQLDLAKNL